MQCIEVGFQLFKILIHVPLRLEKKSELDGFC